MNDQDFRFTQYEAWGEAKVRAMLDGGQLAASRADALLWLATKALERDEAAQTASILSAEMSRSEYRIAYNPVNFSIIARV